MIGDGAWQISFGFCRLSFSYYKSYANCRKDGAALFIGDSGRLPVNGKDSSILEQLILWQYATWQWTKATAKQDSARQSRRGAARNAYQTTGESFLSSSKPFPTLRALVSLFQQSRNCLCSAVVASERENVSARCGHARLIQTDRKARLTAGQSANRSYANRSSDNFTPFLEDKHGSSLLHTSPRPVPFAFRQTLKPISHWR